LKRLIIHLLLAICVPTSFAANAAGEFGAHRWPSEPILSVDLQPDLCKKISDAAVAAFKSVDADIDMASVIGADFTPLKPTPAIKATRDDAPSPLSRLDLDLDGTGHQQVVVYRDDPFNWQGDWHYAYVFPSVADFDAANSQITTAWNSVPQESQYPSPGKREFSAQEYYPTALTEKGEEISTGDVWADHSLFEAGKRFYFVNGATNFDRRALGPVQVFRLLADGHVKLVCQIDNSNLDKTYQAFAHLPAVGSFLATIRSIGAGGGDTGTLHSGAIHDAQANAAEKRAAYRPWATSAETKPSFVGDNPYYRFDERTKAFLEDWSLEELWNRREYQTLMELTGPAEASVAGYLQSAFGVSADAARLDAVRVIQQLIGARLLVPNQFNAAQTQLYFPSTPLHDAVMRRSRAAFDAALATPQAAPGRPARSAPAGLSEAVPDAVEWPYALDQLLAAGADPNRANEFGKTPLMVAAHFDRPDSIRRLLEAGAQVNATTSPGSGMEAPRISARTALMYAAENASPATIKALLDAGADPAARDSDGNDVSAYLSRNPRFTAAERSSGVAGLAKAADEFAGPSYLCSKAKTATEQAICGSEVLRIFDGQIARAFSALRGTAGPAGAEEQRHWLQSRDRSCAADVDCLAEMMRTHLRALQERIHE
jgi:uncharacterized protein YecT (DUF1311 family)